MRNTVILKDQFANMWKKSRQDAGFSQEQLSKKLGISKKTIQNYEAGYSCPDQLTGFRWFDALGLPPLPYYLELLHPDVYTELITHNRDENILTALSDIIIGLPLDMQRKLLFILYGDHGSSLTGIIELIVAYLHTPLASRLPIAQNVLTNYQITVAHEKTADHIKPDVEFLEKSIEEAKKAVINKRSSYTNLKG